MAYGIWHMVGEKQRRQGKARILGGSRRHRRRHPKRHGRMRPRRHRRRQLKEAAEGIEGGSRRQQEESKEPG